MSRHDDTVSLRHMLDHAREAIELAAGRTRDDLERERLLQLALVRLVEIVGEAATRVSPATRARTPDIPWQAIVGMRNRLIHGYDLVDDEILWQTLQEDLPSLVESLEVAVGETSPPET